MPRTIISREKSRMPGGRFEISLQPTKVSRKPRKIDSVPSVTISVGSPKPAMKRPLNAPSAAPIAMAIRKAAGQGSAGAQLTRRSVVVYMAKAATAVKLTSMPPETSTSIAPTAKMPSTMPPRRRSVSVGIDRKPGSTIAATAQKARITPATSVSLRVRSSLMTRACARGRPRWWRGRRGRR